jgi:hypothetical protein
MHRENPNVEIEKVFFKLCNYNALIIEGSDIKGGRIEIFEFHGFPLPPVQPLV